MEGHHRGRRHWECQRGHRVRCQFSEWIDPEAPQERPHVAASSAARPESLPALLAAAFPQMLHAGVQAGVRQALEALSLNQGLPPPTETRRLDRQVEDFQMARPEESDHSLTGSDKGEPALEADEGER